jgi:hypothetical protein
MKTKHRILFGLILLAAMQLWFTGCVTRGYVGADVNYGPRPWFGDGPWMDGGGWYGRGGGGGRVDIDIHPPGFRR